MLRMTRAECEHLTGAFFCLVQIGKTSHFLELADVRTNVSESGEGEGKFEKATYFYPTKSAKRRKTFMEEIHDYGTIKLEPSTADYSTTPPRSVWAV
jgi:hypothetical protein